MAKREIRRSALAWGAAALLGAALLVEVRSRAALAAHVERLVADGGRLVREVDELAGARDEALRGAAREARRAERAELDRAAAAAALLGARREAYGRGIRAADLALAAGDLASLATLLDELAPDLRGFEHGHLRARAERRVRAHPGHDALVTVLAASGDGARIASAGYDDAVLVQDPRSGAALAGPFAQADAVLALALDAAGGLCALSVDDGRVVLLEPDADRAEDAERADDADTDGAQGAKGAHEADDPGSARELAVDERVWALDLDAAGRRLALGTDEGTARVHATADLAPLGEVRLPAVVQAIALTPDGALVAAGDEDGTLHLWSVDDGADGLRSIPAHEGWIAALAVSPDGALVATAAGDGSVAVHGVADGALVGTIPGSVAEVVRALDFGVDGASLVLGASGGAGIGALSLRDARPDRALAELARVAVAGRVERIAACADGRVAFLVGDDQVRVWDPAPLPPRRVLAVGGGSVQDAELGDGGLCVVGSADGAVRVFDVREPGPGELEPVHRFDDHARMARSVAIAPAGDALASGARDGTLVVRRGPGFAERIELPARPAPVEELAFSRDGAVLAVLTADGAVAHLDAATGAERAALPGPAAGIYAAALGPEGATSAFASAGGTLRVFEPATGARLAALRLSDLGRTLRIELAPDGRVLALAVSNASTRLIAARDDVADPTIARLPLPPGGYVDGLAFSPDGARLAVGSSDDVVRVLDAVTGFELLSLATDAGGIRCLAFAPDGRRLVVGGADGRAEVWW